MRRLLALVLTAGLAALGLAAAPGSSSAATPLTGRLLSSVGTHAPIVGITVRMRVLGAGSEPGAIIDTDVTNSEGKFQLNAGSSTDDEFYVQVVADRYQGGYVGGDPLWVEPTAADAATWARDSALGRILDNPAFIHGVVVDSVSKRPVKGVKVTVRSHELRILEGSATTDGAGEFDVAGLKCDDDCALRLSGATVHHETGYRACDATVVPTWGEACASPLGRIGRILLDAV